MASTGPEPISAMRQGLIVVWTRQASGVGPEFIVVDQLGQTSLEVNLRDLVPTATEFLRLKFDNWAEGVFDINVAALNANTHRELVSRGYLAPKS